MRIFARITPCKLKPGKVEAATARARELKPEIIALPGMINFTNVVNPEGAGYVISLVQSRELSDGNVEFPKEMTL